MRKVICLLIFLMVFGMKSMISYGEELDTDISPKEFYDDYADKVVYNTKDDKIYWTTRGKTTGTGASTGYQRKAIRYTLVGTPYYVDTLSSRSDYNQYQSETVGNYYYNMYKVKLSTLLELYSRKYPSVDFTGYFKEKFTIEIDALMAIRVNNVYGCYSDLSDGTDRKGILTSKKATAAGKSAYTGLYQTAKDMEDAYAKYAIRNFESWYDRRIDITPVNPHSSIDYGISVTKPVITGGNNYRYSENMYYVKAGMDFSLSFQSQTVYNGEVSANSTYQPTVNGLASTVAYGNTDSYIWSYNIITSPYGASVNTFTQYSTYISPYTLTSVSQNRSSNLTTLSTKINLKMDEKDYVPQFKSVGRLFVGSKLAKTAESAPIKIIPDGTAPAISGLKGTEGWASVEKYRINMISSDALSGVKQLKIYCNDMLVGSGFGTSLMCDVVKQGKNTIKAVAEDNVGNISASETQVWIDNTGPDIIMDDTYEFEEADATDDYVTVDMLIRDNLSGVARIEVYYKEHLMAYKIFAGGVQETRFNISLNANEFAGDFKDYTIKAVDEAGNESVKIVKMKYNKKIFVKPIVVGTH
ncbi:MAG: hypothetical protein E7266_10130 [Lachnospiraceae bacterium]|nr:hypothetical protein [Lachnospiraceae bacterium]